MTQGTPRKPQTPRQRAGTAAPSAFAEHVLLVDEALRNQIADHLEKMTLRTFDDLADACMYTAAQVARGSMPPEVANSIRQLLELAFTSIAARSPVKVDAGADAALQRLADAAQAVAERRQLPIYLRETAQLPEPVVIDMVQTGGRR